MFESLRLLTLFILSVAFFAGLYYVRRNQLVPKERFANPDVVQTSGMDSFNPLPFYTQYGYPNFGEQIFFTPSIFYDIVFQGPIQQPWGNWPY